MNYYLTENFSIAATVDPQLLNNNSVTSDWVDMSLYRKVSFILNVGATDITVDAKLQEATDSSGTSAQDITGFAITQLTATDDNEQVVIEIDATELSEDYTHVALVVTIGNGSTGAQISAIGLGYEARYVEVDHLASVTEVV
jgi:hypothetical protein